MPHKEFFASRIPRVYGGAEIYTGNGRLRSHGATNGDQTLRGTGVRVNIVGPGPVETRMFNHFAQTTENKANFLDSQIPNKRIGTPE
jgi:NADP-dependent 3-hydroxy acid dehydrogenase YdfG